PRIQAATGTPAQVKAAADAFGLKFSIHGDPSSSNYTVDHAAVMLLFNPQGQFVSLVPHGASAREIVALLARHGVRAA
ncbi:MAG: SCO family protein, partial [Comamonadaceae bacterium]